MSTGNATAAEASRQEAINTTVSGWFIGQECTWSGRRLSDEMHESAEGRSSDGACSSDKKTELWWYSGCGMSEKNQVRILMLSKIARSGGGLQMKRQGFEVSSQLLPRGQNTRHTTDGNETWLKTPSPSPEFHHYCQKSQARSCHFVAAWCTLRARRILRGRK